MVYPVNRYIAVYGGFGMTFKIDDEYGKYKISIGTGRTYKANNVYELRLGHITYTYEDAFKHLDEAHPDLEQ